MAKKNKNSHIEKVKKIWQTKNAIYKPNDLVDYKNLITKVSELFSPGKHYFYIVNFQDLKVKYFSEGVKFIYELMEQEYKSFTLEKMMSYWHEDDLVMMQNKEATVANFLFNKIDSQLLTSYKVSYLIRVRLPSGKEKKILHQAKTINVSRDGKIQEVLGIHADISHIPGDIDHKISFIGDGDLPSYYSVEPDGLEITEMNKENLFTEQELNILKMLAKGMNSTEISDALNLSIHTVKTHRKNILRKSDAKNLTHLISNCVRQGIL